MPSLPSSALTYRDAGVDIDAGDALVEAIKPYAKRTMRPEVLAGIGGFGAVVEVSKKYKNPVLVAGTDGVGTKLKLAQDWNRHDTIGIDLVAMSVNDVLVQGAEPLFFLDYFVCEKLDVAVATRVIAGIAKGCELAGCALIGGETAEHPGTFPPGEYDLAGFCVGVMERDAVIDGRDIVPGDVVLGLASSGPHSNGFSLIRKILAREHANVHAPLAGGPATLADALIAPTRIYVKPMLKVMRSVHIKGLAHITGGGITENVPRVLPDNVKVEIDATRWPRPPVFDWLQHAGQIEPQEMYRTFNCGIGMVAVVAAGDAERASAALAAEGETVHRIGQVVARRGDEHQTQVR